MTTKKETNQTTDLQVNTVLGLQTNYKKLAENHLAERFANNPEFKAEFIKTFSDLIFSQNDEMLRNWQKQDKTPLMQFLKQPKRERVLLKRGFIFPMKFSKKRLKKELRKK